MSFHTNRYDDDFDEQDEQQLQSRPAFQRKPENNYNISDEDELDASSSTDESSSVASVAKAAQLAAGIVLTSANSSKPAEDEPEKLEGENLDDSLNEQVKEMYDYFKEQVSGGTEEESGAESSLNASSNVPENLAAIMSDVLKINKSVLESIVAPQQPNHDHDEEFEVDSHDDNDAASDRLTHSQDLDEKQEPGKTEHDYDHDTDYDKIERSEVMREVIEEEAPNLALSANQLEELDRSVSSCMSSIAFEAAPVPEIVQHPIGFVNAYNLNPEQFDAVEKFFHKIRDNALVSRKFLRSLMSGALKTREDVLVATEEDIDRALETIDRDQDEKITFNEFIELLLLFFSSKYNLAQRLETILKARTQSKEISPNDAIELTSFLNDFFGKSNTSDDLFNTLDLNLSLNPAKLADQLAPKLASSTFVSWEKKREHDQQKSTA